MDVKIKNAQEIEKMRIAGQLAADVIDMITPHVQAGISTDELNTLCHNYIINTQQAIPAPLHYHDFPKSICTSINNVICHGIPSHKKLRVGDIVNIDITVIKSGYHGDTSKMFIIGETSPLNKKLCKVTQECLYESIKIIRPEICLTEIGTTIQNIAHKNGFSVVRDFCGHGIGKDFHEAPQVLHYKNKNRLILKEGMCFTIEPMINIGDYRCKISKKDGWTATTKDGANSAQWEHTILVTATGCEILTLREEETIPRFINH